MKQSFWLLALLLVLCACPVHAEDAYTFTIQDTPRVETDKNYIRISCPLEQPGDVTVTVTDNSGKIVYQRYSPSCVDLFRSEEIYLRRDSSPSSYTVEVTAGQITYRSEIVCKSARLENNTGCTAGYPLKSLSGKKGWLSVTLLDIPSLEASSETYPVHVSNAYTLGSVTFSVRNGNLRATYNPPDASDVSVTSSSVDVALTSVDAKALNTGSFHGIRSSLDTDIPLGGADVVCVLVQLKVSYTPDGLPASPEIRQPRQEERWERMKNATDSGSNG